MNNVVNSDSVGCVARPQVHSKAEGLSVFHDVEVDLVPTSVLRVGPGNHAPDMQTPTRLNSKQNYN